MDSRLGWRVPPDGPVFPCLVEPCGTFGQGPLTHDDAVGDHEGHERVGEGGERHAAAVQDSADDGDFPVPEPTNQRPGDESWKRKQRDSDSSSKTLTDIM